MTELYLYGASGHGKVIAEIAEANHYIIKSFIDADHSKTDIMGYGVLHEVPSMSINVVISIGDNAIRKQIVIQHTDFQYQTLIDPRSAISKRSRIGVGTVVMPGVSINADVYIGSHVIVNTNASVDHDCIIEDYVHISPNAALAGNVTIGEGTHVGMGASVIQGITIGKWCTIGAGAVVTKDVPDGVIVVGVPAKPINYQE